MQWNGWLLNKYRTYNTKTLSNKSPPLPLFRGGGEKKHKKQQQQQQQKNIFMAQQLGPF